MLTYQCSDLFHNTVDIVRIESPVIKNHVGTVVAGIRAAETGGVGQLATGSGLFVGFEISKIVGSGSQFRNRGCGAVGIHDHAAVSFEPAARHHVETLSRSQTV